MTLDLPRDALVLLVGPSGAGKSTWAAASFAAGDVLSSDAFRALVAGDAADQAASADAFKVLDTVTRARLRRGLFTVVDATNLTTSARRGLLGDAKRAGRPAIALIFDVSLERCLAQNARRPGRQVPDDVVRRHHQQLQDAIERIPDEGFTRVVTLRDADLAAV